MQLRLHYNLAGCVITTSCTTRNTFGFKCYIHVYLPICVHYRSSQCVHVHLASSPPSSYFKHMYSKNRQFGT